MTPSIKTLRTIFGNNAKRAREILLMRHDELRTLPAAQKRINECYHFPRWHDIRLRCLAALDSGLMEVIDDEHFAYINAGDTYTATIFWLDGRYQVTCLGDVVERLERRGIRVD